MYLRASLRLTSSLTPSVGSSVLLSNLHLGSSSISLLNLFQMTDRLKIKTEHIPDGEGHGVGQEVVVEGEGAPPLRAGAGACDI